MDLFIFDNETRKFSILNDIPSFQCYTTELPAVHLSTARKGMRNLSKQWSDFPFK